VCTDKENSHTKCEVVSTGVDINEINTELKKVPDDFGNEEKSLQDESRNTVNRTTNKTEKSMFHNSTNNKSSSDSNAGNTTRVSKSDVTAEDNSETQRQPSGSKTLRELAEGASKPGKEEKPEEDSSNVQSNTEQTVVAINETSHDVPEETKPIRNEGNEQSVDFSTATEVHVASPLQKECSNNEKEEKKGKKKSKDKNSKTIKEKKQKSESKGESNGKKSKKSSEKKKSPKKTKVEKSGNVSYDARPDVSSDMKGSSVSLNISNERDESVSSVYASSTSINKSLSSVDQTGSGKKEKKKGKISDITSSVGSNDAKVKKRKKKSSIGTGSKDLPALEPEPEKRRSEYPFYNCVLGLTL